MINGTNVLIIVGIVLTETLSQTLTREYRDGAYNNGKAFLWKEKVWKIIFAFLLYALVLYLLIKTYKYSSFAISNALWDSGTMIATTLVGMFYFKEKLNNYEYMGMGLVIAGSLVLGFKSDDVSQLGQKEEIKKKK